MTEYTDSAIFDYLYSKLCNTRYSRVICGLKPNSMYALDIENEDFSDMFLQYSAKFKEIVRNVVLNILQEQYGETVDVNFMFKDLKIILVDNTPVDMSIINSKFENVVITFDSLISGTDSPKTYIKKGTAVCPLCFNEETVTCDFEKKIYAPICLNITCKKSKMILKSDKVITDDVQTLLLQQPLDKSRNSSPVTFTAKAYGLDVGNSFTGQNKRITGIFRSIIEPSENENDVYIDILSINDLKEDEEIKPTEEEEKKYRMDAILPSHVDNLVSSFAPNIYGMNNIKLSILLQLVGGVKGNKRSDINIFLIGDPSMAKSELLKYAKLITKKSIYTSGRGSTAAGLTIGLVKLSDGRMIAQAGVLPLCSGGFAFIDEFDKMNKDDRSAMHEAMEQQTVSIAKAGIVLSLPAKTSVLAAANPKFGVYDSNMSLRDNVDIPAPLLTRFDLIFLIKDIVNTTDDIMKANHVINSFESKPIVKTDVVLDQKSLITFLNLARAQNPRLTDDVKKEIVKIYNNMRTLSKPDELPVGIRQLEALVRLSYALAKLKMKDEVELEDVNTIKDLIESMYNTFNLSISTGHTQTLLDVSKKQNKQHVAEQIWNTCHNEDGNVNLVIFIKCLVEAGFSQTDAKNLFSNWERFNQVKLNSDGTYKKL